MAKTDHPMRSLFVLVILLCFTFACSNCTETDPAITDPTAGTTTVVKPLDPSEALPGNGAASGNKRLDPQSRRLLFELTQNYWYVHALLKMGDREFNKRNRGRWFRFDQKGTYESGYLGETGKGGRWTYDEKKATLHLRANNFNENGEYRVKMGESGTVMIWEGTERYDQTAIQGKLEKYNRIGDYQLPDSQ